MAAKREPNRIETLPNGVEIRFWDSVGVDGKGQARCYRVGGRDEKWPSVSTIAGVFDKPALMPAAVRLQEEGVLALAQQDIPLADLTQPELRTLLSKHGLHYDSIWGVARDRGDVAHDMLLALVRDGQVPNLADYDESLRPWLSAGMKFVRDEDPEVIDAEYFVASVTHEFAGRGDLLCVPRRGPRAGKLVRYDYKTVSRWSYLPLRKSEEPPGRLRPPYDENLISLAGYELAAVESGYQRSDVRAVVRLGPDGEYVVDESHATDVVFLAALTAYREKRYLTKSRPEAATA
jgi:hypothetical protein